MTGDDIKEQFFAVGRRIGERVQDMPAYTQLKDQFDSLAPSAQKAIVLAGVLTAFAIVLLIPWGWYSESDDLVTSFEDRRAVIRELLKVSREATEVPDIPVAPPLDGMKSELEARLKNANLTDEQIKGVSADGEVSQLIPGDKSAGSLTVRVAKLNIRQIVEVGSILSRISPSVKMTDLEVTASRDDAHYFDVLFRLTALAVPDLTSAPSEPEPPPQRNQRPSGAGGDE